MYLVLKNQNVKSSGGKKESESRDSELLGLGARKDALGPRDTPRMGEHLLLLSAQFLILVFLKILTQCRLYQPPEFPEPRMSSPFMILIRNRWREKKKPQSNQGILPEEP